MESRNGLTVRCGEQAPRVMAAATVQSPEFSEEFEFVLAGFVAVLVKIGIAIASDPVRMAKAFKKAIEAGREAREIGLAEKLSAAAATSPLTGFCLHRLNFCTRR